MPRALRRALRVLLVLLALTAAVLGTIAWRFQARLERIEAAPTASAPFHSPYYLYVPRHLSRTQPLSLLVIPNNSGSCDDDPAVHERKAWMRVFAMRAFVEELGVPLLVPAFPRPFANWQVYTHALDRDTFTAAEPELAHLDRQMLAMIDDARGRLRERLGREIDERVLMTGFSANGMFVDRFALLHPERVRAVAAGSPGGWPLLPIREWQGRPLRYPIGLADVEELADVSPDPEALRALRLLVFLGDQDQNDSLAYGDGWDPPDRDLVNELFGADPVERTVAAEPILRAAIPGARLRLFPGVAHRRTGAMDRAVLEFFREALAE